MINKDKLLQKLYSMNKNDVAEIVKKALLEVDKGWVKCENCEYLRDGECWRLTNDDGCYSGKPIIENL